MRDAYVESLEEMHKDVEKLICALKDTVKRTGQAMLSMDVDMAREIRDGDEAFDNMIRDIMHKDLNIQVLQSPVAGTDCRSLFRYQQLCAAYCVNEKSPSTAERGRSSL